MTVPSTVLRAFLRPCQFPRPPPGAWVAGLSGINAYAAYQRMPSLLTTTVVISPSNLSSSRIFTRPIRGSLTLRPHTRTVLVRCPPDSCRVRALAPAWKADVSRRSAFSQSTSVLSPPGYSLADILAFLAAFWLRWSQGASSTLRAFQLGAAFCRSAIHHHRVLLESPRWRGWRRT